MLSNYAFPVAAERDALRAQLRARFDGHQGAQLCAEHGVCQLPRPTQQRHCSGYQMDPRPLDGRCRFKVVDDNRCLKDGSSR